jgi:glycosyltransferase involved in cell wall biosynthesis
VNKLTALIITHNEELHISSCIDSVRTVADEILIVDSLSTDHTRDIAVAMGARVFAEKFEGFGAQKNKGAAKASYDLILSVDADECISPELQRAIVEIKKRITATAYSLDRLNYIGSRAVKTCGWYPDSRIRLYNRRYARWDDRPVHENLIVDGSVAHLEGDLLHYSYRDLAHVRAKSDYYAEIGASAYKDKSTATLYIKMVVNPFFKFIKMFFLKRGFMDGYTGLMISYYRTRETFLKYYLALK